MLLTTDKQFCYYYTIQRKTIHKTLHQQVDFTTSSNKIFSQT